MAISLSGCMSAGVAQLNGAKHGRHNLKPCIGKEAQARVSAAIGQRKKERKYGLLCVRETYTVACIEKMAAAPIPPVCSGHFF